MNTAQNYWFIKLKNKGVKKRSIKEIGNYLAFNNNEIDLYKNIGSKKYINLKKEQELKKQDIIKDITCAYFIGSKKYKFVKIGFTTNLFSRLSAIQTGCPFDIEILAYIKSQDPKKTEHKLHMKFKKYRVRGEWFKLTDDIKQFINLINQPND